MIHSRCTYEKTNKLPERVLRIVFDDYESTSEKSYTSSKNPKAYYSDVQRFNNISGCTLREFFIRKGSELNFRSQPDLLMLSMTTVGKGQSSLRYYRTLTRILRLLYEKCWVSRIV